VKLGDVAREIAAAIVVAGPEDQMPPPSPKRPLGAVADAWLPTTALSTRVRRPLLAMPPPAPSLDAS